MYLSLDELVEKEAKHVAFGPVWQERELRRAPEEIRERLRLARRWPEIVAKRVSMEAPGGLSIPPSSFATAGNPAAERTLFDSPLGTPLGAIWVPIPANDAEPGTAYRLTCGGIYDTAASGGSFTIRARWGTTTGGTLLSQSNDSGPGNSQTGSWYCEFTATVLTAGATGTAVGNGFWVNTRSANRIWLLGSSAPVTIDTTVAAGLVITITISGTTAAHYTCQWSNLRKLL